MHKIIYAQKKYTRKKYTQNKIHKIKDNQEYTSNLKEDEIKIV